MFPIFSRDDTTQIATSTHHCNAETVVNAAIWPMLAVSTIFLGLRIYCKAVRVRWMVWVDDYLLLAGWAFLVVSSGLLSRLVHLGFGKTLIMTPTMSTVLYCADNTHKLALALTKTSFAVTLLRIATGWQIYLIWFLVVSMNIQFLVHIILTWRAICPRVPGDTTPHLPGTCWEAHEAITLGIFGGFYSALSDFVLALLPWKIVMGLQMRKHEKIGVAVAMSIGVLMLLTGRQTHGNSPSSGSGPKPNPMRPSSRLRFPVLRVLVRNVRSGRGPSAYPSGQYIKSDTLSKFQAPSNAVNTVDDDGFALSKGDASSDRSILPRELEQQGGITRTREVTVEYDSSSRQSSRAVEESEEGIELSDRWSPPRRRTSVMSIRERQEVRWRQGRKKNPPQKRDIK
ncbi:conserved hypothetical protein [Verticillium alfalfae VaMs.102]|uniref:Rhodopsin domain-containing protein n=1 Tax=Verticillium alfalfae (strain VaMs.102 / ATCC MYA-4576 / FGSC 10136) TaxID=526221 RepID=C9SQQ3_VERA1|nr:conserved hypothetical protein [Verticillium alfalfae VaMs.102]EEY21178.1 conserved hypothetical protein [Verticillium alfalfae VaMs.102]